MKADLICSYVCRLLNFMDRKGVSQVTPCPGDEKPIAPFVENFSSGYMQRALASWLKQGSKPPWRVNQNYFRDMRAMKWSPIDDGALVFSSPKSVQPTLARQLAETYSKPGV